MQELIKVLESTYNGHADTATLKQCEHYLKHTPNLLPPLVEIIRSDMDDALRLAATINFKNIITNRWTVSQYRKEVAEGLDKVTLSDEEKQLFMLNSYPLLRHCIGTKSLKKLIVVSMKTAIDNDFTSGTYISHLCEQVEKHLGPGSAPADVLTALEPLHIIFGLDRDSQQNITETVLAKFYPTLIHWATQLAATPFFASEESAQVAKMLTKVFHQILCMQVPAHTEGQAALVNNYTATIRWVLTVVGTPVPNLSADDEPEDRNALQSMKAVKNASECLRSQYYKQCSRPIHGGAVDPRREYFFAEDLLKSSVQTIMQCLNQCALYDKRICVSILNACKDAIEPSVTYALLKPSVPFLITEVCQRWLAYDKDDVEKWEEDPLEVAKADNDTYTWDQADAAHGFVEQLCRYRGKDWLEFILNHITVMLEQAASTPTEVRLSTVSSAEGVDARKDGALAMLGCIASRLRHRKLPMDTVFLTHVAPECASQNPFLRKRACFVIGRFLDDTESAEICVTESTLITLYTGVHNLMQDKEVPVRSQAAVCIRHFFGLCDEDGKFPTLKETITQNFRAVVSSLFSITDEDGLVDNDRIVGSITELMSNFKEAALPFVGEIMAQLVQKLEKYMEEGGEEEDVLYGSKWQTAIQTIETITTILNSMERSGNTAVFCQMEPVLSPLIFKMIGPYGDFELAEDGLALLGNLTFSLPEYSATTWALLTLMYTSLVGGPAPAGMAFPEALRSEAGLVEWGSILFRQYVDVMDNYLNMDTKTFVTGSAQFEGGTTLSYLDMLFTIAKTFLVVDADDYDNKALHTLELLSLAFEGFCQLDKSEVEMQQRIRAFGCEVLKASWQFINEVKACPNLLAKKLSTHIACMCRLWSSMMIWSPQGCVEMMTEVGIAKDVFDTLYASGRSPNDKVIYNGIDGPRTILLGCCALMQQLQAIPAMEPYARGIVETLVQSFHAQITHMQSQMEDMKDDWGSLDSEQELDENEDVKMSKTDILIQNLRMKFDEQFLEDDESFEPSTEMTIRKSYVTEMNEFAILEEVLTQNAMVFQNLIGAEKLMTFKEEVAAGLTVSQEYKKLTEE